MKNIDKLKKLTKKLNLAGSTKIEYKEFDVREFIKHAKKIKSTFSNEDLHRLSGYCTT